MGEERFFLVVNASNIAKDFQWIVEHSTGYDLKIENLSDYYGEVAVQGPHAEACIEKLLNLDVKDLLFYTCKEMKYENETIIVSRTGYTGDVDWGKYVSALTDIGFEGYTCIEIEDKSFEGSEERVLDSLKLSLRYMRQFVI